MVCNASWTGITHKMLGIPAEHMGSHKWWMNQQITMGVDVYWLGST